MPNIVKLHGNFQWLVYRRVEGGRWIGMCEALNLALEAESLDELHSVIYEGTDLLMRDLLEDNEIESYMTERGWKIVGLPANNKEQNVRFELPNIDWRFVRSIDGSERGAYQPS